MPIIKSAIKRVRQTQKRTAQNVRTKRQLREATHALEVAIGTKSKTMQEAFANLQSAIDTAVKKNLIHANRGARIKIRYSKMAKEAGLKTTAKPKKSSAAKTTAKTPKKVTKKQSK